MTATLSVRVYTGSAAATESGAVSGIDFESADNATNSLANRQAHPISVGSQSFEKWLKLKIDVPPANAVGNFKIWGDGAVGALTHLFWAGQRVLGVTPVSTPSVIATTDFNTVTSSAKGTWDANSYSAQDAVTQYSVFQLAVDANAAPGNWGQETISYSFDET